MKYNQLSPAVEAAIRADRQAGRENPYRFDDSGVLRRRAGHDEATLLRPAFVRDIDKILHCPLYNRYADKTQVFSFYKNDDITRRGLHVQLVSRIARTLGQALGLNLDLIEAIALGHDIGHTPFGHAGEFLLDELLCAHTGRHFSHNIHSVRVLDTLFPYNISLQTLNGIAAHDGELELQEYRPLPLTDFAAFDRQIDACHTDKTAVKRLQPATLEGCVVRIADIIAYLGKDRQDAERANLLPHTAYEDSTIGIHNAEIIHNLLVNIVEQSYGKPYIRLDEAHFAALQQAKETNYRLIYRNGAVQQTFDATIRPMMTALYDRLLADLQQRRQDSPVFTHHIAFIEQVHYHREQPYATTDPHQIVTDYIAGMTDEYFLELFAHLFPHSPLHIDYTGYFT